MKSCDLVNRGLRRQRTINQLERRIFATNFEPGRRMQMRLNRDVTTASVDRQC